MFSTGNSTIVHNKTFFFGKNVKTRWFKLVHAAQAPSHTIKVRLQKFGERQREKVSLSQTQESERGEREVGASPS